MTVSLDRKSNILFLFNSSMIQIPGESTLKRNFQKIQEREGRHTPNHLYQPPAPPLGAHPNHRANQHAPQQSRQQLQPQQAQVRPGPSSHQHHERPLPEPVERPQPQQGRFIGNEDEGRWVLAVSLSDADCVTASKPPHAFNIPTIPNHTLISLSFCVFQQVHCHQ